MQLRELAPSRLLRGLRPGWKRPAVPGPPHGRGLEPTGLSLEHLPVVCLGRSAGLPACSVGSNCTHVRF